jgi:putative ATPase
MRPLTLEEFTGQEHILGKEKLLYRLITGDRLFSVIFYGPPGTGKTTLARIIANRTKAAFEELNAVTAGKKDILEVVKKAKENLGVYNRKTILFIDEIHRFNKAQQDALLPNVESGLVILIGATTENPFFEVNAPLLSRSTIFEFKPLTSEDLSSIIEKTLSDCERGYGNDNIVLTPEGKSHLIKGSEGDVRKVLNALELAVMTTEPRNDGSIYINVDVAENCIQMKAVLYEKNGDNHYDTISAFIKSIRGSDPDAAVFWLAKMLTAGEDPKFIARRLMISASEDIGNADPHAISVATAGFQSINAVGMPEARIILSQVTTYLAAAPKSNAAYMAINQAIEDVKNITQGRVPKHLKDSHYSGAEKLGNGEGYKYPHSYPGHYVLQQYLPDMLKGKTYYEPTENGYEKKIGERIRKLKNYQEE